VVVDDEQATGKAAELRVYPVAGVAHVVEVAIVTQFVKI
jgi:Tfp pilus assembly protein PilN